MTDALIRLYCEGILSEGQVAKATQNAHDGKDTNIFTSKMKEAHDYLLQCNNPAYLNWARLDFIWL